MQAGAIVGPIDRSAVAKSMAPGVAANTVHDLNVPYEGPDEYETPTADLLFPPVRIVLYLLLLFCELCEDCVLMCAGLIGRLCFSIL